MRHYDIRVEVQDGSFHDRAVNAPTMADAKAKFERVSGYRFFEWRGLVVFVDGAFPCEEASARRRRLAA